MLTAAEWRGRPLAKLAMSWKGCKFKLPGHVCQLLKYVYCMMSLLIISLWEVIFSPTATLKMSLPCQDYSQFFLVHRLFWVSSLCPFPPGKKGISENEAGTRQEGTGPDTQLSAICFAWSQFFEVSGFPGGQARRGIVALCTRSVLTPFAVIISFSSLDCIGEFSIEFADHIICWDMELPHFKGRNPLLLHLANSLTLVIQHRRQVFGSVNLTRLTENSYEGTKYRAVIGSLTQQNLVFKVYCWVNANACIIAHAAEQGCADFTYSFSWKWRWHLH